MRRRALGLGIGLVAGAFASFACGGQTTGKARPSGGTEGGTPVTGAGGDGGASRGDGGRGGAPGRGGAENRGDGGAPDVGAGGSGTLDARAPVGGSGTLDAGGPDASADAGPGDAAGPPTTITGAYLDGDFLDLRVTIGRDEVSRSFLRIDVNGDGDASSGGSPGGFERNIALSSESGLEFFVMIDGFRGVALDPCDHVAYDVTTDTLRLLVPRTYLELGAPPILWLSRARGEEGPPVRPVESAAPPFDGTALCNASQVTFAEGTYTDLWALAGLGPGPQLCALTTGGDVRCWGYENATFGLPPPGPFTQIGVRRRALCGLRAAGGLDCWDAFGEPPPAPALVPGYLRVSRNGACAVLSNGNLRCEACAPDGLGTVERAGPFVDIGGNCHLGCAIREGGSLDCWAPPPIDDLPPPIERFTGTYRVVAAANTVVCAIGTDGTADCAVGGQRALIRLHGTDFVRLTPAGSVCATTIAGKATCIGVPPSFPSIAYREIAAGEYVHPTCAITLDGRLGCWGGLDGVAFP